MGAEVAVIQNGGALSHQQQQGLNREQVDLIKRTIAKGATDDELQLFKAVCEKTGLDPFARQIFAVKRWDSKEGREVMQTQVSIDGFRLVAERSGKYAGQTEPQWCGPDGAWRDVWLENHPPAAARVGVLRKDFQAPVYGIARYDSYVQCVSANKGGGPNSMWKKMSDVMLSKCAESLALRKAFPQELSGLYTSDEMGQADNPSSPMPTPQQVAESKIAQMQHGTPYAQTQAVPLPIPAELQPPEEVQAMWAEMKNITTVCNVFSRLRSRLVDATGNEDTYYRILMEHGGGAKHANELKQKAARQACWRMYDAIVEAEAKLEAIEAEPVYEEHEQ